MHLANGAITPTCAILGFAASTVGGYLAYRLSRRLPGPSALNPWHFALATAAVFAAQTCNITVLPGLASGHFVGGLLLAFWFGPALAVLGMTLILITQSMLFADGGLLALGCNVFNMGVIPAVIVYPLFHRWLVDARQPRRGIALLVASASSTVLAATACSFELLSRSEAGAGLVSTMVGVHALIGLIEAAWTLALVAAVSVLALVIQRSSLQLVAGFGASVFTIVAAVFGASPWPDGLEYSLERHGVADLSTGVIEAVDRFHEQIAIWPDYASPFAIGPIVGLMVVALITVLAGRSVQRRVGARPLA